jgi:hypothetical protein
MTFPAHELVLDFGPDANASQNVVSIVTITNIILGAYGSLSADAADFLFVESKVARLFRRW